MSAIRPNGNAKNKGRYTRIMPSTRDKMKSSIDVKGRTPKEILDDIYCCLGDVEGAKSLDELPRGPQDLYSARCHAKRKKLASTCPRSVDSGASASRDSVWMLLERAKHEEEISKEDVFIRECKIHPALFVVLATKKQLSEMAQFCTNPSEFSVLAVDPTFNIFAENISLTVTTFQNHRLLYKETDTYPVFIGPLWIHQRKDWRTYSNFAHSLITEQQELEGLIACGTDGEKALIDGFKKNFRFTLFLRCFLHFKENIQRELGKRGISGTTKQAFVDDIFGKQEESTKFYGLVDCMTEEEFDVKLESMRVIWMEREESRNTRKFFDWFK